MTYKEAYKIVLENAMLAIPEEHWNEELGVAFDVVTDHAIKQGLYKENEAFPLDFLEEDWSQN